MVGRALASSGRLAALITDAWEKPGGVVTKLSHRLRDRYHPELSAARVEAPRYVHYVRELHWKYLGKSGWHRILDRNAWFENMAAKRLRGLVEEGVPCDTVFSYSYAARSIFHAARSLGLRTVLGQIDPGPVEDELVADLYERAGQLIRYERIPAEYWERWREETALSDVVVVNSDWSKKALMRVGVAASKITVLPLAYDLPKDAIVAAKPLPEKFTHDRPLRLLFLGQVTFRKGIGPVLEAIHRMPNAPIRIDIVGEFQIDIPASTKGDRRVFLHGAVQRSSVKRYYRDADLFLFPTLSDGFGLTQLEALAHGLPVLVSRNCGEVIEHDVNGYVLDSVTPEAIERVLRELLDRPDRLRAWAEQARILPRFSREALAQNLSRLTT